MKTAQPSSEPSGFFRWPPFNLSWNAVRGCSYLALCALAVYLTWERDHYLRIEGTAPPGMTLVIRTTVYADSLVGRRMTRDSGNETFSAKADAKGHYSMTVLVKREPILSLHFLRGGKPNSASTDLYLYMPPLWEKRNLSTEEAYRLAQPAAGISFSDNPADSSCTLTCEPTGREWDCGLAWAPGSSVTRPLRAYGKADPFILHIK